MNRNAFTRTESALIGLLMMTLLCLWRLAVYWRERNPNYNPLRPDTVAWLSSFHMSAQNEQIARSVGIVLLVVIGFNLLKYFLGRQRDY